MLLLWEHVRRLRKITEAAVTDEACEAEHIMARTPATSIQGIATKFEAFWSYAGPAPEACEKFVDTAMLKGAYDDAMRLAAGGDH